MVGRPSERGAVDEHAVQVAEFLVVTAFGDFEFEGALALAEAGLGDHHHLVAHLVADFDGVAMLIQAYQAVS